MGGSGTEATRNLPIADTARTSVSLGSILASTTNPAIFTGKLVSHPVFAGVHTGE
jgi:hypothetical protein